jgi:hypothetical protein
VLGKAAVAMWWHVAPEHRAEWEEWHTVEHMPERLAIPGFLRGSRWSALSGEPAYFVLYEVVSLETLMGGAYLERLNNPTPWSLKMMPLHLGMVRSLCLVKKSYGEGVPYAMGTSRFSLASSPSLPRGKGLTFGARLQSQPMPGGQTTEQKIRGGDATADSVLLVGGYDAEAVSQAIHRVEGVRDIYRLSYCLHG